MPTRCERYPNVFDAGVVRVGGQQERSALPLVARDEIGMARGNRAGHGGADRHVPNHAPGADVERREMPSGLEPVVSPSAPVQWLVHNPVHRIHCVFRSIDHRCTPDSPCDGQLGIGHGRQVGTPEQAARGTGGVLLTGVIRVHLLPRVTV